MTKKFQYAGQEIKVNVAFDAGTKYHSSEGQTRVQSAPLHSIVGYIDGDFVCGIHNVTSWRLIETMKEVAEECKRYAQRGDEDDFSDLKEQLIQFGFKK